VRPAAYAGRSYPSDPTELRRELDAFFVVDGGPGPMNRTAVPDGRRLTAVLSPHIDPTRGGPALAWAYKTVAERSDADLFVIFGTAHHLMDQWFCASRKDFDTPLGAVRTDRAFIDRLAKHLASSVAGRCLDLFEDELAHRSEHSIEFQALFLQHVLGGSRDFRIVPILVGSFHEFVAEKASPAAAPEVQAFLAAVRFAAARHSGKVCYISGADLAHVGQRFGDPWLLDKRRLAEQSKDDRKLLELACRGDSESFFRHVALQGDCRRICGLSPTYTMLAVLDSARGELLKYGQAVEEDGTACVSFASAAFY
jgi:MEMO1 family protein